MEKDTYRTVNIGGKDVKITFHKFLDAVGGILGLNGFMQFIRMSVCMFPCRKTTFYVNHISTYK